MHEERFTLIETKIAFQESTIQELNDVVAAQQEQISKLETLVARMAERLQALNEQQGNSFDVDERPPHY